MKPALRGTTGLLLSTAVLATGCGGGSDTMRATLTDDGCTYEGDTTHAPGPFHVEVENKTSHFASFDLKPLAAGKNVEDVRQGYEQINAALEQGKDPKKDGPPHLEGLFDTGDFLNWPGTDTVPEATSQLPVNASSGRFVIVCVVWTSGDDTSSGKPPPPAAFYVVPAEIEVR